MQRFVKPSKTVTDAQKIGLALEAASFEISADVGVAAEKTFAPWLEEGEACPAQEQLRQELLGRWLRQVRERLVAADEAHQDAVRAERSVRRRRDGAAKKIEGTVRAVRTTFEKVYGEGLTAEVVGLASDIPDDPVVLHRYAQRIVRVMADPELELPDPRVKGSAMGPGEVIEQVTPLLEILDQALLDHEPSKRQTQLALEEKRAALTDFNYAAGRIARYLEALCYLAGRDFHAERVRQSSHGRLEEDETFLSDEGDPEEGQEAEPEEPPADGSVALDT